jgi:hypothetical protein
MGEQVLLDTKIRPYLLAPRRHLLVTDRAITLDDAEVPLNDAIAVAFGERRTTINLVPANIDRTVEIAGTAEVIRIVFKEVRLIRSRANIAAWETLVSLADRIIGPRICSDLLSVMRGGDSVDIAGVTMDAAGFELPVRNNREAFDWSQFRFAEAVQGFVHVFVTGRKKSALSRPMTQRNVALLPRLMPACAQVFGNGGGEAESRA